MTTNQALLLKLGEECNEVAQRCSKAIQFGMDEVEPGQPFTNWQRLAQELQDAEAVREMCLARGLIPDSNKDEPEKDRKKAKVEKFLAYSRSLGQVVD